MKLKNIIICGVSAVALSSCCGYLDVDAPSKYFPEKIFNSTKDVGTALNGVYTDILGSNTFGNAYTSSLIFNTDVDFASNSSATAQTNTPKRYDMTAASSTANSVWNATYAGIENANNFINYLENSEIYKEGNEDYATLQQYMGEAKVLRAMLYNELMCYWGDVPFTLEPTSMTENFSPAITSRDVIAKTIIEDLIEVAPNMKFAADNSEGIERASKEACWALISRIALQAAGYSLRHEADDATTYGYMAKPEAELEKWFLEKAREYSDMVIKSHTHSLGSTSFQDVFLNECNFIVAKGEDPIFELPFTVESSGYVGYNQGPKFEETGGSTDFEWGKCGGGQQVTSFYRYSFKNGDMRKNAQTGWWYYTYDGIPKINNGYSMYNNKWSKLFNTTKAFNKTTAEKTGINYPYLRYADVLLMFAEADLKLNGAPTAEAMAAVQQVRDRAYIGSTVSAPQDYASDYDGFLKNILDERKWEFAGENSRWKDLVRNNMLAENLYHTFFTYYTTANWNGGMSDSENEENVCKYDGVDYYGVLGETFTQAEIDGAIPGEAAFGKSDGAKKGAILPTTIYYCYIKNPKSNDYFANNSLNCLYIYNKEADIQKIDNSYKSPEKYFKKLQAEFPSRVESTYTPIEEPNNAASTALKVEFKNVDAFAWYDDGNAYPKAQAIYSFFGFIRGGEKDGDKNNVYLVRDGQLEKINANPFDANPTNLPVVRYLLPIPREAITRAAGAYKNYYGYGN